MNEIDKKIKIKEEKKLEKEYRSYHFHTQTSKQCLCPCSSNVNKENWKWVILSECEIDCFSYTYIPEYDKLILGERRATNPPDNFYCILVFWIMIMIIYLFCFSLTWLSIVIEVPSRPEGKCSFSIPLICSFSSLDFYSVNISESWREREKWGSDYSILTCWSRLRCFLRLQYS